MNRIRFDKLKSIVNVNQYKINYVLNFEMFVHELDP